MFTLAQNKIFGNHTDLPTVAAGIPYEEIHPAQGQNPESWQSNDEKYIALRVIGNSMFPKYLEGDIVIARRQSTCDSKQDCIVLVLHHEPMLKTVIFDEEGGIVLRSINPEYPIQNFTHQEVLNKEVQIVGVVVEIRRQIIAL